MATFIVTKSFSYVRKSNGQGRAYLTDINESVQGLDDENVDARPVTYLRQSKALSRGQRPSHHRQRNAAYRPSAAERRGVERARGLQGMAGRGKLTRGPSGAAAARPNAARWAMRTGRRARMHLRRFDDFDERDAYVYLVWFGILRRLPK